MRNLRLYTAFLTLLTLGSLSFLQTVWAKDPPRKLRTAYDAFIANKGQWQEEVLFRNKRAGVETLVRKDGWTLYVHPAVAYTHADQVVWSYTPVVEKPVADKVHGIGYTFIGNKGAESVTGVRAQRTFYNYYLGNDQSKWARKVHGFEQVNYCDLYAGVDVHLGIGDGGLKYNVVVSPHGDLAEVVMEITGAHGVYVRDNILHVETIHGVITEDIPYAYELVGDQQVAVEVAFVVLGANKIGFRAKRQHPEALLVIDPDLISASFNGATAYNRGSAACFDKFGNTYATGLIYGESGAPLLPTVGVFQPDYVGGCGGTNCGMDVNLAKFNKLGTALLYFSYIGGDNAEASVSLTWHEPTDEVYILGTTGSGNFPTTSGVAQQTHAGGIKMQGDPKSGQPVDAAGAPVDIYSQADIFVLVTNSDASELRATFVGGSGNDGLISPHVVPDESIRSRNPLYFFYGDNYRGQLRVDDGGDVYVASTTASIDFPSGSTPNSTTYQGGSSDGVVFKLTADLSTLLWRSFVGSNESDALSGGALGGDSFYVTGGTNGNIADVGGGVRNRPIGGLDGLVVRVNRTSGALTNSTYAGTNVSDRGYLIDVDTDNNVYIFGSTVGAILSLPASIKTQTAGNFCINFRLT